MISDLLTSIGRSTLLPVISLILAMVLFIAVVIWVLRLDKRAIQEAERLPLDDSDHAAQEGDADHV
jgi:cbb3-type cytochrome oxidase subunit 3